jgi:hypothetical protein
MAKLTRRALSAHRHADGPGVTAVPIAGDRVPTLEDGADTGEYCQACGYDRPSCVCALPAQTCIYCGLTLESDERAPYCGAVCAIDADMERRR